MRVARCDDVVVVGGRKQGADRGGDGSATFNGQRATLAEVVLHVDDDERPGHGVTLSYCVGSTGSPGDSCVAAGGSSASERRRRSRAVARSAGSAGSSTSPSRT